jgi:hypothetical protein
VVPGLAYSTPYHWRVQALNSNGAGAWSDTRTFKTQAPPLPPGSRNSITEDSVRSDKVIEGGPERSIPKRFLIGEGYPNPFNPQTKLSYELAGPGHVVIAVYDLAGREIARLVDEDQQAGYYDRVWDADNRSSGVYYARIVVTDQSGRELFVASRKLLLLK